MLKPNVVFDIDGVLAESTGHCYQQLANRGYPLDINDNTHYFAQEEQLQSLYGMTGEEAHGLLADIFWSPGALQNLPVRVDGLAAYRLIASLANEIHLVTARHPFPHVITETTEWVERHGMGSATLVFETDKAEYMKTNKLHYIIEDAPHTAETAFRKGFGVVLVDHSYNRHVKERERLWRVDSVNQAAALIAEDWAGLQAKAIIR